MDITDVSSSRLGNRKGIWPERKMLEQSPEVLPWGLSLTVSDIAKVGWLQKTNSSSMRSNSGSSSSQTSVSLVKLNDSLPHVHFLAIGVVFVAAKLHAERSKVNSRL